MRLLQQVHQIDPRQTTPGGMGLVKTSLDCDELGGTAQSLSPPLLMTSTPSNIEYHASALPHLAATAAS
jgi:hypothetical protein